METRKRLLPQDAVDIAGSSQHEDISVQSTSEPQKKSKKLDDFTVERIGSASADVAIEASEISASQNNAVSDENTGNQSSKQKPLEINAVLCFLSNKIDIYSRKLLESTVLEFFSRGRDSGC